MRNLVEYPITSDEVLESLDTAHHEIVDTLLCGGIDGLVLVKLKDFYIQNPGKLDEIVEYMKISRT